MTTGDFTALMSFLGWCMGQFFTCLDSVYIGGFSLLQILVALIFLDITFWFISKVFGVEYHRTSTELMDPGKHTSKDAEDTAARYGVVQPSDHIVEGWERGSAKEKW